MDITIFGANGPTGRLLTRQALAEGHSVTAVTRHPEAFPLADPRLQVLTGDVLDAGAVETAVAGRDAVLSTLGAPFGRQPVSVYSVGVAHMLDAMGVHGVKRLICVSSSTMSPPPDPQGGVLFRRVVQPYVVNVLGRTVYEDMARMEDAIRQSDLDWTIVRPSGLFSHGEVTDYRTAEDHLPGRFTAREDLAACLLRLIDDRRWVQRAVAVSTVAVEPSILGLVWREGVRKR
jgi:putative NADH-flavin reductase